MNKDRPIKSMTAFGRKSIETDRGTFVFEIQSLNRRFLEINLNLVRSLTVFDGKIRAWLREKLGRGAVTLSVYIEGQGKDKGSVAANIPLAKEIKKGWEDIAKNLNLDFEKEFHLSLLSDFKDVLMFEQQKFDELTLEQTIKDGVDGAIGSLMEMKIREGNTLKEDIEKRIETLSSIITEVEANAGKMLEPYAERLKNRLAQLSCGEGVEQDERIRREIVLIADRSDYTEEVVRFKSHLAQLAFFLNNPLEEETETRGKKIEFLLQELARELNTISSKAMDAKIAHVVVDAKAEVEKIREQVQNIE